jgi:hypothetical protein
MFIVKTRICKQCGNAFALFIKIDGQQVRLYGRSYCLDCYPIGGEQEHNGYKKCPKCQDVKPSKTFHRRPNGKLDSWCKECGSKRNVLAQKQGKVRAIAYKGGKCQVCSYDKCADSLQFHHLDPSKKEFRIALARGCSWVKLQRELDKCVLVCANCHGEIHAGVTSVPKRA